MADSALAAHGATRRRQMTPSRLRPSITAEAGAFRADSVASIRKDLLLRPTLRARSAKATKSSDPQANDLQACGEGDAAPMDCRVGAHALSAHEALSRLGSSLYGLDASQAAFRLKRLGPNTLPRYCGPDLASVVWHQFKSPMIVVLVVAAGISALLQSWSDAGFILAVLALNATIGSVQEWRAERSALALQGLIALKARVLRAQRDRCAGPGTG